MASDLLERLRADILHNRLEPSSRLRFRDLRERYQSGLSPVREALMRLVAEGLVVLEDHKGFRVAPIDRDEMIDIANTLFQVEGLAIRMAVERGDDGWEGQVVARFHALSKREMFAADGSLDVEWEARHVAFHESLYAACGSPSLTLVCRVLYDRYSRYRRLRTAQGQPDRNVLSEHDGLMRAVLARHGDAAVTLLKEHRSATMTEVIRRWPTAPMAAEPARDSRDSIVSSGGTTRTG